ncbi:MAG: hypothetical protein BWZ09_02692 [Alphaproteobacteria bacterium ADurb.BinA305]|nr:MAG: hypothetical protein BWZ09_02692 [Alphaproteobacteria bacterium ADurb.BinA305]
MPAIFEVICTSRSVFSEPVTARVRMMVPRVTLTACTGMIASAGFSACAAAGLAVTFFTERRAGK